MGRESGCAWGEGGGGDADYRAICQVENPVLQVFAGSEISAVRPVGPGRSAERPAELEPGAHDLGPFFLHLAHVAAVVPVAAALADGTRFVAQVRHYLHHFFYEGSVDSAVPVGKEELVLADLGLPLVSGAVLAVFGVVVDEFKCHLTI